MYSETKKNTPNIASATRSMAAFAPAKVGLRNRPRSSIGTCERISMTTNPTRPTAATTKEPTIRPDIQP